MRDLVNVEAIPFEVLDQGITWDWETFPQYHGRRRRAQARAQSRLPRAADAVAPLRDGRGVDGARGLRRGTGGNKEIAGRSGRCRRVRLLQHAAQPAHGLRGPAARLPQREPRRTEGLLQRAEGTRQGLDRDRDDQADRGDGRSGARAARFHAAGERAADHLHRDVRPRRHLRGGAHFAAEGGADDRARRAAADLAAAADARDQHAQPLLLRRLPVVEARVRGQVEGRAGRRLPGPRLQEPVQGGTEAPGGFRQLGAHRRARSQVFDTEKMGGQDRRRSRRGAGQGRGRRLPRSHARRRPRQRVHHGVVQQPRRPDGGDPQQPGDAARPGRRRRAPRHAVRRGLPDLHARHLGARKEGAHAGGSRAAHDLGPCRFLRHPGPRPAQGRASPPTSRSSTRRRWVRRGARNGATTCPAARSAW